MWTFFFKITSVEGDILRGYTNKIILVRDHVLCRQK